MTLTEMYESTGHLLRRAHQQATALFVQTCGDVALTGVQFAALTAIVDHPGVDATRLSALISFDRSTIGGVVDRLEQKGLLVRAADVRDRRIKLLYATPSGSELLIDIDSKAFQVSEQLLAPLAAAERPQFVKMLRTLIDAHAGTDAATDETARSPRRAGSKSRVSLA